MMCNEIIQVVSDMILTQKMTNQPFVVGINGKDGSGKTFFAKLLTEYLSDMGKSVVNISIDDFHNPKATRYSKGRDSAQGYYYDSMNFEEFKLKTLQPIKNASSFPLKICTKIFDLNSDKKQIIESTISKDTLVIIEGVFLFKPEMLNLYDLKILIDVDTQLRIERMIQRDIPNDSSKEDAESYKSRIEKKYIPGQDIYFAECDPLKNSDIVINNNDYQNPEIA